MISICEAINLIADYKDFEWNDKYLKKAIEDSTFLQNFREFLNLYLKLYEKMMILNTIIDISKVI